LLNSGKPSDSKKMKSKRATKRLLTSKLQREIFDVRQKKIFQDGKLRRMSSMT
jgi:hypothetical protein